MKNKFYIIIFFLFVSSNIIAQSITISPNQATQGKVVEVNFTGVNTNFYQGTSTTNFYFKQGTSTIWGFLIGQGTSTTSSGNADVIFDIAIDALTGYYDVIYESTIDGIVSILSGFYVKKTSILSILNSNDQPIVIIYGDSISNDSINFTIIGDGTSFTEKSESDFILKNGTYEINNKTLNIINDSIIDISFVIPNDASTGYYDLLYTNVVDGNVTLERAVLIQKANSIKNDFSNRILIYPNPSSGQIIINSENKIDKIDVLNLSGQVIYKEELAQNNKYKINLEKGIYFVKIYTCGEYYTKKIIIN